MSNGKWQPSRACWQPLNEEYGNLISPIRPANETAFPRRCEQKANDPRSPAPSLSQEAPPSPSHVDKRAVNFIFSGKQSPSSPSLPALPRAWASRYSWPEPSSCSCKGFPPHPWWCYWMGNTICRCHPSWLLVLLCVLPLCLSLPASTLPQLQVQVCVPWWGCGTRVVPQLQPPDIAVSVQAPGVSVALMSNESQHSHSPQTCAFCRDISKELQLGGTAVPFLIFLVHHL